MLEQILDHLARSRRISGGPYRMYVDKKEIYRDPDFEERNNQLYTSSQAFLTHNHFDGSTRHKSKALL